jgi:hypothetical protein
MPTKSVLDGSHNEVEMPGNSSRSIVRVIVESDVSVTLGAICEKRGMTQVSVLSRLVRWCVKQEETIQNEVLNSDPMAESNETSRRLLRDLANSPHRSERKPKVL